ncbi:hypothetical protein [Massilia antarctica]|uniref:hypothetical protein n=1 Tax=Massilia antarctica TaxID=2765360 RepID=UPI0006BB67CA|nr:hypothetical protein [Massilia sp. H27-R4]MCY0913405.1 hypothetical protein [Massilia sp. H27-R4]
MLEHLDPVGATALARAGIEVACIVLAQPGVIAAVLLDQRFGVINPVLCDLAMVRIAGLIDTGAGAGEGACRLPDAAHIGIAALGGDGIAGGAGDTGRDGQGDACRE